MATHDRPIEPARANEQIRGRKTPSWKKLLDLGQSVPAEEWAKLPTDLSSQIDHYLYRAPKAP